MTSRKEQHGGAMITKRLNKLHRSRQIHRAIGESTRSGLEEHRERTLGAQSHPKKLVAAVLPGLNDQLTTSGWLNPVTVGIPCEEEPVEWTAEDYENMCDN